MALREKNPGAFFFILPIIILKIISPWIVPYIVLAVPVVILIFRGKGLIIALVLLVPVDLHILPSASHLFDSPIQEEFYSYVEDSFIHAKTRGSGLAIALTSGQKNAMSEFEVESFITTGNAHLLALSGMHFAVLASILSIILIPISIAKFRLIISSLFAVLVLFVIGPLPSLTRACFFLLLLNILKYLEIRCRGFDILVIAFIFQIYIFPEHLQSMGFLLSYASVAGLLLFKDVIRLPSVIPPFLSEPWSIGIICWLSTGFFVFSFSDTLSIGGIILSPLLLVVFSAFYICSLLVLLFRGRFELLNYIHDWMYGLFMDILGSAKVFPSVTSCVFFTILIGIFVIKVFVYIRKHYRWVHGL